MSNSLFLARLIGPVILVVGLAVFINPRAFREISEEFMASQALMFISGLLVMPAGLAIVLVHNLWTADWRVIITIFGWIGTIGAVLRLLAPQFVVPTGRAMLQRPHFTTIVGTIWIALGLLFCFFGYWH
jgi:uncharacterized protein YjeT (DUF2065 family)